MDIKDRERQRKKLGPVEGVRYVDAQRDVAVDMGERDIRREILKHRGKLKSSTLADEADNLGFLLLLEQALKEMKSGSPVTALTYLDKGLQIHPEDGDMRVWRGRAYIQAGLWQKALEDAKEVFYTLRDSEHPGALIVMGEGLYGQGDFEHGLMWFNRGLRNPELLMSEREEILAGIKKTEEAINNAVGDCATSFFQNVGQVLDLLPRGFLGVPWFQLKTLLSERKEENKRVKSARHQIRSDSRQDKKFLHQLANDKAFLQDLVIKLEDKHVSQKIVKEARGAAQYLSERREFWSQQNPRYLLKTT
ncbi:uncharacterized protein LOC111696448 isoform X2 [Eurytemora carolleeae]|nr:uncharacterized protein LOC111696448 isoform X2 [Eurytemora carolleeae]|eukprot:XP_023321819.1 uncharacterized protein LOC111696448 isoform X2 [Eurytemora affinis]